MDPIQAVPLQDVAGIERDGSSYRRHCIVLLYHALDRALRAHERAGQQAWKLQQARLGNKAHAGTTEKQLRPLRLPPVAVRRRPWKSFGVRRQDGQWPSYLGQIWIGYVSRCTATCHLFRFLNTLLRTCLTRSTRFPLGGCSRFTEGCTGMASDLGTASSARTKKRLEVGEPTSTNLWNQGLTDPQNFPAELAGSRFG